MSARCPKCNTENSDTARFCSHCAAPLQSSDDILSHTKTLSSPEKELTEGSTFAGRYEIIEVLGKGGMGKVYKALDNEIHEEVAIKLLKPEIAADETIIPRFRNELKIARKISHENVCRMYHFSKDNGNLYITMEYVRGEDLKSLIKKKERLFEEETLSIAKQVCEGLVMAHKLGVIHRDLKPQNIMIDDNGHVKIMDFGIARSVEAAGVTEAGMIIGTPDYISPEQAEGEEADFRSDIYSLGVILYEMLTGTVPFKGDTALSVALKHKSQLPFDPRKLNPKISDDMRRLILICMEKDKERRYQTAEALLNDLQNIEQGLPLGSKIRPKRATFTQALIRNKLFIPGAAFLALVILVLMAWYFFFRTEEISPLDRGRPSLAIMHFENNTGEAELDHWRKGLSDLMTMDLNQSKFIYVLPGDVLLSILDKLDQREARAYSSDVLNDVASRGAVNHILIGNYVKAGDTIRINVTLKKAGTNEVIGSESAEGQGEESFFAMVDDLTRKIKSHLQLSTEQIAEDIDMEGAKIATSSPEAFKFYSEAQTYYYEGDLRKAASLYQKAIAIDPEFAIAYYYLGWCYSMLGYGAECLKNWKEALNLSDRLRAKERYLIQATFYRFSGKTQNEALQSFTKLLELYPEDFMGNFEMGRFLMYLEEWDKALDRFDKSRQEKPYYLYAYWNIAGMYEAKGMYDKAIDILKYYLENYSDNFIIHKEFADIYTIQRQFDLALNEADKVLSLPEGISIFSHLKGDIYFLQDDFVKAREEYERLLLSEEESHQRRSRQRLPYLLLAEGKVAEARESLLINLVPWAFLYIRFLDDNEETSKLFNDAWDDAVKSDNRARQKMLLYAKSEIFIRSNALEDAQKAADQMQKLEGGSRRPKRYLRLYDRLLGLIELKKGNYDTAIEHFNRAVSRLPSQTSYSPDNMNDQAFYMESLALAYYKSGDLENAIEEFDRITKLTTGRFRLGDIYAKSFYMLGKIYEEQGDTARAIEHYKKFLDLWKNADPGITEVEDARKRLANLT